MKRLLLFAGIERDNALAVRDRLEAWLDGRARAQTISRDDPIPDQPPDAIVVFGGDGTILEAAHRFGHWGAPVLGINLGRLGYLAEVPQESMFEGVEALLQDEVRIEERMQLVCRCNGREVHALNDVLVGSDAGRMVELEIHIDGAPLSCFRGDGAILATPTGSTAHSLSAGGPILAPTLRAMVLTPVCPHELAIRPLVISARERVTLNLREGSPPVRLDADGRTLCQLADAKPVTVEASGRIFRLAQLPRTSRYDILRQKLGWGGSRCLTRERCDGDA